MKAKIKATGEIINIASYAKITLDKCDSYGTPIEVRPEDVELIQEQTEDKHWQDVRERAAIAAMQGLISNEVYCRFKEERAIEAGNPHSVYRDTVIDAVLYADALIEELKKKYKL